MAREKILRPDMEAKARMAGEQIVFRTEVSHRIGIVAGSGWGDAIQELGPTVTEFKMKELSGFTPPTIEGHAGFIDSIQVDKTNILVFRGRRHRYEFELDDYECMDAVVHNVRTARAAGCEAIILTNAVGGLNPSYKVGQAVVIADHNDVITAAPSPLRGGPSENFLNCNALYDHQLRLLATCVDPMSDDPMLPEGIYTQVRGPHFETPAAATFLRSNGIDLVGMSIIQETIEANRLGMRVLGISLVTDAAGDPVTHEIVQGVVRERAPYLGRLLRQIIERM